jgi:hypothetical protein
MMKTLAAILILSTAAWAQDRPKEDGDKPRPEGRREGDAPRPRDGDKPRPREGDQPRPREGDQPRPPAPREGQRPRDGEGAPGRRPNPAFNPEAVRGWLKENEPETFRHLTQAQAEGRRDEVQHILGDASMRMHELNDLKERDPKGFERMQAMRALEREGMELAEQARRGPPEEKEAVTKKLLENLSRQFDLREEQRMREIAELKRRIEGLEKALSDRKGSKERIVERRKRELLGEKVDEDW